MEEDMNLGEQLRDLAEENQTRKILEILNTLLYSKSIPVAIFTDENPTPVFLESQKHIRDKIRAYSNIKTEKKRKGGTK